MAANITCYVGRFRRDIKIPRLDSIYNLTVNDWISRSSIGPGNHQGIKLGLNRSRLNSSVSILDETTAAELHRSLARLTRNSPASSPRKVNNIGLIFADTYRGNLTRYHNVFGMMFDVGFKSGLGNISASSLALPREGCVVFLNSIARYRTGKAYDYEACFTAIHELGHVFNLQHTLSQRTFMSSSPASRPHNLNACFFKKKHMKQLNACHPNNPLSKYIHPGSSPFIKGDFFNDIDSNRRRIETTSLPLDLHIELGRKIFYFYEPVELDVSIFLQEGIDEMVMVPDQIDPGYSSFKIWIEDEFGRRREYRSPRLYCTNPDFIEITRAKPFLRDISLFGESGSHTFAKPGKYKIQAEFDPGFGELLVSNTVNVEVKDHNSSSGLDRRVGEILKHSDVALLLYHRDGYSGKIHIDEFKETLYDLRKSSPVIAAEMMYALGRHLVLNSKKLGDTEPIRKRMLDEGLGYLLNGADTGLLSRNRTKNILKILELRS